MDSLRANYNEYVNTINALEEKLKYFRIDQYDELETLRRII